MYPFLKPGDRLIVSRVSQKSLQIGDIVLAPDLNKKVRGSSSGKDAFTGQRYIKR